MTAERWIRKLSHGARLAATDEAALSELANSSRHVARQTELQEERAPVRQLPLILSGWAYAYRLLENGKRQIVSILLPGDLCEPFGTLPRFSDRSLATFTSGVVASVSPLAVAQAIHGSPRLEQALWWDLLVSGALDRERIVSFGRRSAQERLGHLLCELYHRLDLVGLTHAQGYALPMSQVDLADALGLSMVHVNRSLQELRRSGMISLRNGRVTIHDLEELQSASMFDLAYLHLRGFDASGGGLVRAEPQLKPVTP